MLNGFVEHDTIYMSHKTPRIMLCIASILRKNTMKTKKIMMFIINIIILVFIVRLAASDDDYWDFRNDFKDAKIFTVGQVKSHNTVSDCYMIVKGDVYDITRFIQKEDKAKRLLCGTDNSELYAKLFGKKNEKIEKYYVGKLSEEKIVDKTRSNENEKEDEVIQTAAENDGPKPFIKTETHEKTDTVTVEIQTKQETVSCPDIEIYADVIEDLDDQLNAEKKKTDEKDAKIEYLEKRIESLKEIIIALNQSISNQVIEPEEEVIDNQIRGEGQSQEFDNETINVPVLETDDNETQPVFSRLLGWIGLI